MANTLSKNNITDGNAIEAWNVTQSVDAFTGIAPYNITISGSLDINEAPITNLTASIISASVGITGSLFGVASTSSYVLAANIFQPFTNLTASGDINVTAITASEYIGLPSGLVSGSPQIPSLLPSGVVSGSAQIPSLLPSGVVSGSAQTVANLPSGVVSGSAQLPSGLYSSSLQVLGNITSSGNISASGGYIIGDGLAANNPSFGVNKIAMDADDRIDLSPSNSVAIRLSSTAVTLNKPTLVNGEINVTGNISSSGAISASQIDFADGTSQTTAGGGGGGSIGGSITSTQVAFGSTTSDEIEGEAAFVYNKTADRLDVVNVNSTNLSGSLLMTGHILPDTDATYDIGSATFKVRDLYLDNSTLYFGTSSLSVNAENNEMAFNGSNLLSNDISGNAETARSATISTSTTASVSVNNAGASIEGVNLLLFSGTAGASTFSTSRFSTQLTGKTLGTNCFITVTFTSAPAEPTALAVSLASGTIEISDSSGVGSFSFTGQIYYF